jgi:hypothetical protein
MEITNQRKGMPVPDLLAVWGAAFLGGTLGSVVIGLIGIRLAYVSYPNSELDQGAALVGAVCGSFLSIPIGIFVGGLAGVLIYNFSSRRNSPRPAVPASLAAFMISALIAGVSLVPVGVLFFGLGHI